MVPGIAAAARSPKRIKESCVDDNHCMTLLPSGSISWKLCLLDQLLGFEKIFCQLLRLFITLCFQDSAVSGVISYTREFLQQFRKGRKAAQDIIRNDRSKKFLAPSSLYCPVRLKPDKIQAFP